MPKKPLKPCQHAGCVELVESGYCQKHKRQWQKQYDEERGTAAKRGYDRRWQTVRRRQLLRFPMCQCQECQGQGRIADMVHHIKPISEYPELKLNPDNLLSMNRVCHEKLHGRKKKYYI